MADMYSQSRRNSQKEDRDPDKPAEDGHVSQSVQHMHWTRSLIWLEAMYEQFTPRYLSIERPNALIAARSDGVSPCLPQLPLKALSVGASAFN